MQYALLRSGLDSMSLPPQTRRLLSLLFKDSKASSGYYICADTVIVDGRYQYNLSGHYMPVIVNISSDIPEGSIFLDADTVHRYYQRRCAYLRINRNSIPNALEVQMGVEKDSNVLTIVDTLDFPLPENDMIAQLSQKCDVSLAPDDVLCDRLVYNKERALMMLLQLSSYDYFALERSYGSYEHTHPSIDGRIARSIVNLKNAVPNIIQVPGPAVSVDSEIFRDSDIYFRYPQLCAFKPNVNQEAYRKILRACQHSVVEQLPSQSGMEMAAPASTEPASLKAEPEQDANKPYKEAKNKNKNYKNKQSLYSHSSGSHDREFGSKGVFSGRITEKPPPGRSDFPTLHNFTPKDSR